MAKKKKQLNLTDEQKAMFNPDYIKKFEPITKEEEVKKSISHLGINAAYERGESPVLNRDNKI